MIVIFIYAVFDGDGPNNLLSFSKSEYAALIMPLVGEVY